MAEVKISQLPTATSPVASTDYVAGLQSGVTVKMTLAQLQAAGARQVANITALRALTGTPASNLVMLVSNWVAGDGGGTFRYDSTDTTTADNGGTVIVDASGKRWKRQYDGPIDVRWFKVIPNVTGAPYEADNVTGFVAALTAGPTVFVPNGSYFVNSTINWPALQGRTLKGESENTAIIYATHTSSPLLKIQGASTASRIAYPVVENLSLVFANPVTTPGTLAADEDGAVAIKLKYVSRAVVRNISTYDALLGMYVGSVLAPYVESILHIRTSVGATSRFRGTWVDGNNAMSGGYSSPNPSARFTTVQSSCGAVTAGGTVYGFYVSGSAADLWVMDCETGGGQYGFYYALIEATPYANLDVLLRRPVADGFSITGVYIDGGSGVYTAIAITDLYAAPATGATGYGLDIRNLRGLRGTGRLEVDGFLVSGFVACNVATVYDVVLDGVAAKNCGRMYNVVSAGSSTFRGTLFHDGGGSFTATNANYMQFLSVCEVDVTISGGATVWTNGVYLDSPNGVYLNASNTQSCTNKVNNGGAPITQSGWYSTNVYVTGLTGINETGTIKVWSGTAIPAGGGTGVGVTFSSTSNFGVFFGSGVPTLSAAKGSLYLRSDGSTTVTRAYINTDGGTTWTAVTTVA